MRALLELKKACKNRETPNQRAFYLVCGYIVELEKRIAKMEAGKFKVQSPSSSGPTRMRARKRKDGTDSVEEWVQVEELEDGTPVYGFR